MYGGGIRRKSRKILPRSRAKLCPEYITYSKCNVFMHSNHSAFSHVGSNQRTKCHHKTQQSANKNPLDNFLPYEEFIQNFLGSMILNLLMSIKKYK